MTIILDENLPRGLVRVLAPRSVITVQEAGFAGLKNGRLLAALEGVFDILITGDKNLRDQQTLPAGNSPLLSCPPTAGPPCVHFMHGSSKPWIVASPQVTRRSPKRF